MSISEIVGLRSKTYSLIGVNDKEVKKAKGINKSVVKKMRHDEFVSLLFNKKVIRHNMKRIQSCIELVLMISAKFRYLVLMIKGTY